MEEIWKDITLASLNPIPNAHFQPLTVQDFLSQPFCNRNPNPNQTVSAASSGGYPSGVYHSRGYPSPASPPPIALSLNTGPGRFNSMCNTERFRQDSFMSNVQPNCLNKVSFDELASASGLQELGRKSFPEGENSVDRCHKRMIKNRESAAKSRARRQAYTNELELELAHLTEENVTLKKQQQLCLAAAKQAPKKHALRRSATALF